MRLINYISSNFSGFAVITLDPIQEVPDLNIKRDAGYCDRNFLKFLQTSVGIVPGRDYCCFTRNSLKFIIHQPPKKRICKFRKSNAAVQRNANDVVHTQFIS
jgi:hypothetical protein